MPVFLVFAACAFASGFALRLADPIVLPVAAHFAVTAQLAAMLNTAYALPYALAQPFLGPIGDRFGKPRCIQVCVAGLAAMLLLGALAPSFPVLMATRICAGIFAGGLIPLVLAGLGDSYDMSERQVMIGRMLLAIISGQMLGSVVSGFANDAFGWHGALFIGAAIGACAAAVAWLAMPAGASAAAGREGGSFAELYRRVLVNPKAPWLVGGVCVEGMFFYGLFPYMGELLLQTAQPHGSTAAVTGLVLGAFGIGGLLYAASVRALLRLLGMRRMCLVGAAVGGDLLRRARGRADLVAGGGGNVRRRHELLHAAQLDADRGDRARALGARLGGGALRLRLLRRPGPRTARLRRPAARAGGAAGAARRGGRDRRARPGDRRQGHRPPLPDVSGSAVPRAPR